MRRIGMLSAIGLAISFPLLSQGLAGPAIQESITEPDPASVLNTVAAPVNPTNRDRLVRRLLDRRETVNRLVNNSPAGPAGLELTAGRETLVADPPVDPGHGFDMPDLLIVGRNNLNPIAQGPNGYPLAEPGAANEGRLVFSTGNTHHEYSIDGGVTYTPVAMPLGPLDAQIPCCDLDVIYDKSRAATFHSVVYTDLSGTNGVVRIFVRRNISLPDNCSYTIDPAAADNNIVPDYPHLGITKSYLYLTTNNLIFGDTWAGSQVRRFSLDQMANCSAAGTTTFTYGPTVAGGQRVFVPIGGTEQRDRMYWGMLENRSTFRIFQWPDSAAEPVSVTRSISPSTFTNPDCSGGANHTDFIERGTAWSITGFRMRGALGVNGHLAFYWNVGPDAVHPRGHVHAAVFSEPSLSLTAQPHIWSASGCFGYPIVAANDRGDFGLTIAFGGQAATGSTAVQGYVGMDDQSTAGVGFFGTVFLTTRGTHNPADSRYGDYMTIHPQEPCGLWFSATSYALNGGTEQNNVNSRYIEFGKNRDRQCYFGWRDETRIP